LTLVWPSGLATVRRSEMSSAVTRMLEPFREDGGLPLPTEVVAVAAAA
jgi:hypothetical protein